MAMSGRNRRRRLLAHASALALLVSASSAEAADPFAIFASDLPPTQPFVMGPADLDPGTAGEMRYSGMDSAGSASLSTGPNQAVIFEDEATASSAAIVNNGGATLFLDRSTAASAQVTANSDSRVIFGGTSTAADSRLITNEGGVLEFRDTGSAGSAFIANNGTTVLSGTASASNAEITNNEGANLAFVGTSNAGIARIANNGTLNVQDDASLSGGLVTNNETGAILLSGRSSAGAAFMTNNGSIAFVDTASLASGGINNNEAGLVFFSGASNAGTNFIANSGRLRFSGSATAATAEIVNNAAGSVGFDGASTSGAATISNAGRLAFAGESSAGAAAIGVRPGGSLYFGGAATGGSAAIQVDAGGTLDVSALRTGGVGFAALTGAGDVFLGSKVLTVGDDTPRMNFDGQIADGGFAGGAGGGLTKTGSGTLNLSGTSSYTGPTLVSAGALEAGATDAFAPASAVTIANGARLALAGFDQTIGSLSGSGTVDLATGALLTTGGTGASTSYDGRLTGTGGLLKTGGGTLRLGGTSDHSGVTTLAQGGLVVDGDLAASRVETAPGTLLSGTGRLAAAAVSGAFAPGDRASGASLSVAGDLTLGATSTWLLDLTGAPLSPVSVGGTARLDGGTLAIASMNGGPGTALRLIDAAALTGAFGSVTTNAAFLTASLAYTPQTVSLLLERNDVPFPEVALGDNGGAVAGAIETLSPGNPIYNAVVQLDASAAGRAFDALSGEMHATLRTGLIADSNLLRGLLLNRTAIALDGLGASAASPLPGIEAWTAAFGARGENRSDGSALRQDTAGAIIGVDAPVAAAGRLGFFAGIGHADQNLAASTDGADVDSLHIGLYGGGFVGPLSLKAGAAYTRGEIDTSRSVVFPGFQEAVLADYGADLAQAYGEVGYPLSLGGLALEPFANLAHVWLRTDSFNEWGGAAALSGASETQDVSFVLVGLRGAASFELAAVPVGVRGLLGWRHAFGDLSPTVSLALAGAPFSISGVPTDEDAAVAELGLTLNISESAAFGLSYIGEFGNDLTQNGLRASFDVTF